MEHNPFDALGNNNLEPSDDKEFVAKLAEKSEEISDHDIAIFVARVNDAGLNRLVAGAVAFEIAYREMAATELPPTGALNEFFKRIGEYQYRVQDVEFKLRDKFIREEDERWRAENPEKAAEADARRAEKEAADKAAQQAMIDALMGNAAANGSPAQSVADIFGGDMGLDLPEDEAEGPNN